MKNFSSYLKKAAEQELSIGFQTGKDRRELLPAGQLVTPQSDDSLVARGNRCFRSLGTNPELDH